MSIKDIFGKSSEKILSAQQLQNLYDEAESEGYLEQISRDNQRFLPSVDFSSPSNFARYGSAEKYYTDAIKNIYQKYPYDGSRKEKLEWRNNSSQFDLYVFDEIYPKTTGFITLNSASQQYVTVKGGPNTSSTGKFEDANIFDISKNRESNLAINPLNLGNTVEFWFKETGSNASTYPLFDLWNGNAPGSSNYTRFLIEKNTSGFKVTYCSGTSGVVNASLLHTHDISKWHNYAFSIASASSGLDIKLFIDGQLENSITTGSAFSQIANNSGLIANIGSYRSGSGYVNGCFDEFRFWKEARSTKNISRFWFTSVGGGSNTDDSNTELGIYFKFNEGIVSVSETNIQDARCLDYSGRVSNGTIVNYNYHVRNTGSAINEYSSEFYEYPDPILYPINPLVSSVLESYQQSGSLYDVNNNSNIFKSIPSWIAEESENKGIEDLSNLVQIISSYFDTLHIQIENLTKIKEVKYIGENEKPLPFINKILSSYDFQNLEIFNNTTFLEDVLSRNETDEFEKSLIEVKNTIYQNIFNNLNYIYKSKGTEKSLRNLIRCFGVDDELIKINLYADNTQYDFSNKYQYVSTPKKFVDFNDPDRYEAVVYQNKETGDTDSRGFILGDSRLIYIPITLQAEVIFPKKARYEDPSFDIPEFTTVSLFGAHTADPDPTNLSWGSDDFKLVVTAEKRNFESSDVFFKLSGSFSGYGFQLTSSYYNNTYNNEKWNFAVRIKHSKLGSSDFVSGSSVGDYYVEFVGNNCILDTLENTFTLSKQIPESYAKNALSKNKRIYAGAHYVDFDTSNSPQYKTDIKVSSVRFWFDYLTDEELLVHSHDASNYGRMYPNWNAGLSKDINSLMLTKADLLALNWDFNSVTGSNNSGEFIVVDASSGSLEAANKYGMGWFGSVLKYRHPGVGVNFVENDNQVVNKEFVFSAKQQQPETLAGSDLIQIKVTDDINFTKNTKPIAFFYSIEKSMSQVINDEILNWFATIDAFNNLIGQPINRYTKSYKGLDHLRKLFFEKVQNEPDFEKFIEFYKWIDSSISLMIVQLVPASANISEKVRNIVESHLLERNKYENKLPTIELKSEPVAITTNILPFSYRNQQAPTNPTGSLWLKQRADRTANIEGVSSGDAQRDANREQLRQVIYSQNLNNSPKQYDNKTGTFYEGKKDFVRGYSKMSAVTSSLLETPIDSIIPVNISNNLFDSTFTFASASITGSGQILEPAKKQGNYRKNYEFVQTSGRSNNNKALPEILENLNNSSSSPFGTYERSLPDRPIVKSVFVERFSAPGGPEVNSRGALDQESEEFSVYNGLNNRNSAVRNQLNKWFAETSSIDSSNPSYHKTNKNAGYKIQSGSNGFSTTVDYDNQFVSHQIPRSDVQYSWITSSLISKQSSSAFFSQYDNLNHYGSASIFLSGTISGSSIIDYVGLNLLFSKNINTASNVLSVDSNINLNSYLLNINGPYQNPSWKHLRTAENKLARISRENNYILSQNAPEIKTRIEKGKYLKIFKERKSQNFTNYKEPPIEYNSPIENSVQITGSKGIVEVISTYDNNKNKFANKNLAKSLGVKERSEPQTFDILKNLENGLYEPRPKIKNTTYKQIIYPKKQSITLKESRTKPNYDQLDSTASVVETNTFWNENPENRKKIENSYDMYNFLIEKNNLVTNYRPFNIYNQNYANYKNLIFSITQSNVYKNSIFSLDSYYDTASTSYQITNSNQASDFNFYSLAKFSNGSVEELYPSLQNNISYIVHKDSSAIYFGTPYSSSVLQNRGVFYWDRATKTINGLAGGVTGFGGYAKTAALAISRLLVGGWFRFAGSGASLVTSSNIAAYDFTTLSWKALHTASFRDVSGITSPTYLNSILTCSQGIFVGGYFNDISASSGGVIANTKNIARYVTSSAGGKWFALGEGLNNIVNSILSASNGIYAAGNFLDAGGTASADYISRWDGARWNQLGSINGYAYTLYSASSGIYLGGAFTGKIKKLNAGNWDTVGSGVNFDVYGISSDSSGLYAVGGNTEGYISKYDGTSWSEIKTLYGTPYSVLVENAEIYAGGNFTGDAYKTEFKYTEKNRTKGYLNNISLLENNYYKTLNIKYILNNISYFDTTQENFYKLNGKLDNSFNDTLKPNYITGFASSSQGLYIIGNFAKVSGSVADMVAVWNGQTYSQLENDTFDTPTDFSKVVANTILSSSIGIVVGGPFLQSIGAIYDRLMYWNGTGWSRLYNTSGPNKDVKSVVGVGSTQILAGGKFNYIDNLQVNGIASWNLSSNKWYKIKYILNTAISYYYIILDLLDTGRLSTYEPGYRQEYIDAKIKPSIFEIANSFAGFSDYFLNNDDKQTFLNQIDVLNAESYLGQISNAISQITRASEYESFGVDGYVNALATSADGKYVYLGGYFSRLGIANDELNPSAEHMNIARYKIGKNTLQKISCIADSTPLREFPGLNGEVKTICPTVEGGIFIGGSFQNSVTQVLNNICYWKEEIDLNSITSVGEFQKLGEGVNGTVESIVSASDGIYVAGSFTKAYNSGGEIITANNIIKWNGNKWIQIGRDERNGFNLSYQDSVYSLLLAKDKLFIGGKYLGTRSGPIIKDRRFNRKVEAFSGDLLMPKPQLVFNNFIPPSVAITSGVGMKIAEVSYDSSNTINNISLYSNGEYITTLNNNYVYEIDKISGKKPFFDSYEEFSKDIKPISQKYTILPEYKIDNFIEKFIKEKNGNFNSIIKQDYLSYNGFDNTSINSDVSKGIQSTDIIKTSDVYNDNDNLGIKIKISGIKKVRPEKGFYPSERIVQLTNYFLNSFLLSQENNNLTSSYNKDEIYSSSLSNGATIDRQALALIQPLFAPGILLNTIKSSIAVDFPTFITNSVSYFSKTPPSFYGNTGSNLISSTVYDNLFEVERPYTSSNYINTEPNFRFPFEALLEFDTVVPENLKTSDKNLYYLNPTYYTSDSITGSDYQDIVYPIYNMGTGSLRKFGFFDNTYKLAMHNFLAEIPNFFLGEKLNNFVSLPETEFKTAISGTTYYMDVVLNKKEAFSQFMADPYYESLKTNAANFNNGTYLTPSPDSLFGPPVRFWDNINYGISISPFNFFFKLIDSPSYAPYVPAYYYGKSVARISFTAEETRQYSLSEIQSKAKIQYINNDLETLFQQRASFLNNNFGVPSGEGYKNSPAYKQKMNLSASINLFSKKQEKNVEHDSKTSNATTIKDKENSTYSWVIQTKFETPSINFINCNLSDNIGLKFLQGTKENGKVTGIYEHLFKGMWTTYGTPVNSGEGIDFYIQNSFPEQNSSSSLIDLCGFQIDEKKTIGLIGDNKIVQEGVIMIPYTFTKNHGKNTNSKYAETIPEILGENGLYDTNSKTNGPYYYKIDREILSKTLGLSFDKNSKITFDEIKTMVESDKVDKKNSIVKLISSMVNYVIPPHLNWLKNLKIDPFVMYIADFSVKLDREDLGDIWQGLMPKPSLTTEIEDFSIEHKLETGELFHGLKPQNDTRFKIFKVKQSANINYYKLLQDSSQDSRFKFNFGTNIKTKSPNYSFNYPYDYFSIVEMANIEVELQADKKENN